MKLVVGLGNPGKKYIKTRHNVGFIALDDYVEHKGLDWGGLDKKFNAYIAKDNDTLYVKPQTFMNNSGECVSKIVNYYKINLANLIVIHDDVDLELGKLKYGKGQGTAGHHGVESIAKHLDSVAFNRLRIGIGRPEKNKYDVEDWVLEEFSKTELDVIRATTLTAFTQYKV